MDEYGLVADSNISPLPRTLDTSSVDEAINASEPYDAKQLCQISEVVCKFSIDDTLE